LEGTIAVSYTLPFTKEDNVIELGGGTRPYFRPNLDVRAADNVDIVANFHDPLPINDSEYNGIFSSYCIEHISWRKLGHFIKECYRILKNGGTAVFITANTEKQMQWVLDHDEWDDNCSCIIFGDQDYDDNTHKNSLNPKHAIKLFREAGFKNIRVVPHGELATDMIIEASKKEDIKMAQTTDDRKGLFDQHYFNGGGKVGGYAYEGYWDYPVHWVTFEKLMELQPKSVLEIGAARGYLVKRFESAGIPAKGVEISKHCHLTRVTDSVHEFDICQAPWPFKDKEFDLCYSVAVMEHIPEEYLPAITKEMERVSERGLHGIDFGHNDDGFDKTHCTLKSQEWWEKTLPASQKTVNKEELEQGSLSISIPSGDGKLKLNIGSFTVMFHNGWINTDIVPLDQFASVHQYKFVQHDIRTQFPFEDNSVDLIVSSHVMEHINEQEGLFFLQELQRIMKPGAVARIAVPDAETLANLYHKNELGMFDEINGPCKACNFQSGKLWSLLFEGHRIAYDFEGVKHMAEKLGFHIEKKKFNEGNEQIIKETMDFLPDLSLYVEITKK
jgi:predicted SAM-dependent methyltransferase